MTVSATTTRNDYIASSGQTVFAYTFKVLASTDLVVTKNGVVQSAYSVSHIGVATGGTVTFNSGVTANDAIALYLAMPVTRDTNYQEGGAFLAGEVNSDFDKIYIGAIQNENAIDRSLRLPDSEPSIAMTLPSKADRLGAVLGFNATTGAPEAGPTIAAVGTVADIAADIETVAGISTNVTTVSGISADVTDVASISSAVTNVNNISADITAVNTDPLKSNINTVAGIASDVTAVSGIAAAVTAVNGNSTNINAVNANSTNINTVAGSDAEVTTVADNIADVTGVNADLAGADTIGAVAGAIANVNAVGGNIANVNTVAADSNAINAVNANATNINAVNANETNINTVAGDTTAINQVASAASDITAVNTDPLKTNIADVNANSGNINAVAGNASNINTVAGDSTNIQSVIDNLSAINDAPAQASAAATSAGQAASSASSSSTSAGNSSTSATASATSASNASGSETNAATSATNAASSETNAAESATTAGNAQIAAEVAESAALTSSNSASTFATNSSNSADAASGSASAASGSASAAASSASAASTSASNAATSETNAASSASAAATSATNAATSETNAAASATDSSTAASTWNSYYNTYVGASSSAPTVDVQGNALVAGALYFNTTNNTTYVWTGSAWNAVANNNIINPNVALTQDLATNGNDIKFGDNDKATFGAGDDLQLYHDGSDSFIKETGAGSLKIWAKDFEVYNAGGTETLINADVNAGVQLYFDNEIKLATTSTGIDVTGSVVADGLTVEAASDALIRISDSTNANQRLDLQHNGGVASLISGNNGAYGTIKLQAYNGTDTVDRFKISANGDVDLGYEDTGTTAKMVWDASEESLTVGDELKLRYTGSASLIDGGDSLRLRATNDVKIQNFNSTEIMAQFIPAGAVTLYYANSPKLATTDTGINVTGTATMDGLTVDGSGTGQLFQFKDLSEDTALFASSGNTSGKNAELVLRARASNSWVSSGLRTNTNSLDFYAGEATGATLSGGTKRMTIANNGDISFYEDTGTTPKLFWDASAESLGIGTAPSQALHVSSASDTPALFESTDFNSRIEIKDTGGSSFVENRGGILNLKADTANAAANSRIEFSVDNSECVRIDSSGHAIIPAGVTLGTATGVYAAANTLDDYEEGAFTPQIGDVTGNTGTLTTALGYYTKVGRQITIVVDMINMDTTALVSTEQFRIKNLPFSAFTASGGPTFTSIAQVAGIGATGKTIIASIQDDFGYVRLKEADDGLSDYLDVSNITSPSADIRFSLTYFTN